MMSLLNTQQVVQLLAIAESRAAGWVRPSYDQKWKTVIGETIFYGHYRSAFNHCDVIDQQSNRIRRKRKIRAITPRKVVQDHRGRYQSKARMRLPISDN